MATSPEHAHASEHDPLSTHSRVPLARARAHSAPEPAAGASCAAERAAACTAAQEVKKRSFMRMPMRIETSVPRRIESSMPRRRAHPGSLTGTCATVAQAVLGPKPLTRAAT